MGESCSESIDLPLMDQKVVEEVLLEVSSCLFGCLDTIICVPDTSHLRAGTTSMKIHDMGLLMGAIEG